MTEEDYKLMAGMDPKMLQQMMGLGGIDEQQALLQQQMAMAEALRSPDTKNYGSVGGNIGAGLGNIAGQLFGGHQQQELMGQQKALAGQRQEGRGAYANALADALRGRYGPQQGQGDPSQLGPLAPTPAPQPGVWSPPGVGQPFWPGVQTEEQPAQLAQRRPRSDLPPPSFFGL